MALPCDIINPLADFQLSVVTSLNKKLVALQHLAQLLEQLGDAAVQFMNDLQAFVDHLVPVVDINFDIYLQLVSACPFINLPPVTAGGEVSTAALQAMVTQAYNNMTKKLLNHPYTRMASLQGQLDDFMQQANAGAAVASEAYQCLIAACNGDLFSPQLSANASAQLGAYKTNFVVNGGRVLNPTAQAKALQIQNLTQKMQALGATVGNSYVKAKFALTASQTPTGTFSSNLNYQFVDNGSNTIVINGKTLNYRGDWDASVTYGEFDVVTFNGVLYLALDASTDSPPNA